MVAVEGEAPGLGDVEAGVGIAYGGLERDGDAADGVDERTERTEVDLDEVVGVDPEVLVDRVDQLLRVVAFVGLVDAALSRRAGDVDEEVAGKRQHGDLRRARVDAPHHDGVAAFAQVRAVAERRRVGRVGVDARVVVGAGDQEVLGGGFDRGERLRGRNGLGGLGAVAVGGLRGDDGGRLRRVDDRGCDVAVLDHALARVQRTGGAERPEGHHEHGHDRESLGPRAWDLLGRGRPLGRLRRRRGRWHRRHGRQRHTVGCGVRRGGRVVGLGLLGHVGTTILPRSVASWSPGPSSDDVTA